MEIDHVYMEFPVAVNSYGLEQELRKADRIYVVLLINSDSRQLFTLADWIVGVFCPL